MGDRETNRELDALGDEVARMRGDVLRRIQTRLLTTAGDLLVRGASALARLPAGTVNGHVLTVDTTRDVKMKWAAPAGGGPSPASTVVAETSYGAASSAGASADYARGDHTHGTPALGTSGSTACAGNDSRLSDPRAPTGSAGGDLGGTYPNPTVTQARGLRETSGPTTLTAAAIPDLSIFARSGTTVAGVAPPTSGQRVGKALGWTSDGVLGWVPIAVVVAVLGRGDIVIEGRTVLDHATTTVTVGIL